MKQHYDVCRNNWVCKRLSLNNIEVEEQHSSGGSQSRKQEKARRGYPMNIINLLLDEDSDDN